mgnify:CR=1 FL=1
MRGGKYEYLNPFTEGLRVSSSGWGADVPGVDDRIGVGDDFPSSEFMEITLGIFYQKICL